MLHVTEVSDLITGSVCLVSAFSLFRFVYVTRKTTSTRSEALAPSLLAVLFLVVGLRVVIAPTWFDFACNFVLVPLVIVAAYSVRKVATEKIALSRAIQTAEAKQEATERGFLPLFLWQLKELADEVRGRSDGS